MIKLCAHATEEASISCMVSAHSACNTSDCPTLVTKAMPHALCVGQLQYVLRSSLRRDGHVKHCGAVRPRCFERRDARVLEHESRVYMSYHLRSR